jgi:hypothetical protein
MNENEKLRIVSQFIQEISAAEKSNDYTEINRKSIENRLGWYKKHKNQLQLEGSAVRKAYTLVILEFMELSQKEAPVVYEDDRKIVWRSYNWCPVLEACKRAGFDTRKVCKKGWEKSVQAMIEKINPRLRFTRNYKKIRPYTEYCEEIVELK